MQYQLKQLFNGADERGFSLIELMVVVAILAAVVAISAPNLKTWQDHSRVNSDARNVLGILQHARIEAVKRNEFVSVVFTNNNTDGENVADYRIFVDKDADRTFDAGETSLVLSDLNYAKHTASFTGGVPSAIFNSRGMPSTSDISVNFIVGNIKLDNPDDTYSKKVIVAQSGRVRIE
ncbi:MAG: hypothetical protein C0623_05660 [Desulfuromonas sp.]|nr:MAG: hypothetical protein C0623_05660 [Desulfuromonas sp.]